MEVKYQKEKKVNKTRGAREREREKEEEELLSALNVGTKHLISISPIVPYLTNYKYSTLGLR